jgi:hypothetical protein
MRLRNILNQLIKKLKPASRVKKIDIRKFVGTIKFKEDPLIIQKKLRDEWE